MSSSLKEYNRKRDFKKTKEPSGKKVVRKSKKLLFVVQEHHASHLHYDFRLELDGVLKSWAVPKGPSMDPADKRLAVQVEDHPLGYEKFHGTIPKGEYGGGEVFIWDNGTWTAKDDDPMKAIEIGRLEFSLKGKKLSGNWILVRTHYKGSSSKKNWLLMKRSDDVEEVGGSSPKKKVAKKATQKKTSLRDPWPGFIEPQLPRLVLHPPKDQGDWIHEMKFDGYRIQAHVKNGIVEFYTRKGLNWSNKFPHLVEALGHMKIDNGIFDGEVVALDEEGVSDFQKLQNSLTAGKDQSLRFYLFDCLYLNGEDLRSRPLVERKQILENASRGLKSVIQFSSHFNEQGEEFFQISCQHKLEGIISKLKDSTYSSGRNDNWVKTKCIRRQEFVIGGWTEPKGGRMGIGALLLGVFENEKLKYVGKVGTGFNNQSLMEMKKKLTPIEVAKSPFALKSPKERDIHWVKPDKVCEVSYLNFTDEGVLRTPVFIGMRDDKPASEIHVEKEKVLTKKGTKKVSKKKPASKENELVSSPDKILFKQEKKTKLDVAEFYQAISKHMLPYMKDRPLSLVRCPNGSEGKCFFQKHVGEHPPEAFHTFDIEEEKGQGTYISIDSVDGLLELVQLNAFELHVWNSHAETYLWPDQIVMDFDPDPVVPWKEVVSAAFELKEMLEDLDLKSFVKLTGGKGLHVHVPIAPLYTWDQVKSFCQSLAFELESRNPKKYVSKMTKKLRKGKIFVDYLRNGYGATAIAPYSLRARPTTALALPLEWSELKKLKGPQEYTMDKALKKIKTRKKDPWAGMLKHKQKIKILKPASKES